MMIRILLGMQPLGMYEMRQCGKKKRLMKAGIRVWEALGMVFGILGIMVALMIPLLFFLFYSVVRWKRLGGIYCPQFMIW